MKTCTDHSFIVVYQDEGCPVCAMERELREAKREADRMGKDNDRLCDKIFDLERGQQAVGR